MILNNSKTLFPDVSHFTFITSESCNLNCQYCELAKSFSDTHLKEAKKVKQALYDGTFLTNYQRFAYDYNINIDKIKSIDLWGQETTTTLDAFNTQIFGILKWLRNCENIFFSTNGIAYPERIIDFIKQVDYFLKLEKNSNRQIKINIQFSVDGFDEDISARGTDANIIFNNLKTIIEYFKDYELTNKLEVFIIFHGVITLDIINNGLKNGVSKHWHDLDNAISLLHEINTNYQITIAEGVSSAFQTPVNASKQDGKNVAEYLKQCINLNEIFKKSAIAPEIILNLYTKPIKKTSTKEDALEEIIDVFNYDYWQETDNDIIEYTFGCGTGIGSIKLRYDGTLMFCQNSIFSLTEDDLKDKQGIKYDIQRFELKNNFNPNVFTSSKKDIEKFITRFDKNHFPYPFVFAQTVNQMYLLLENNQIDDSYKTDTEKLLRHAGYIVRIVQCWYNQVIETGSIYPRTFGTIRFYCNGALDIIEQVNEEGRVNLWK